MGEELSVETREQVRERAIRYYTTELTKGVASPKMLSPDQVLRYLRRIEHLEAELQKKSEFLQATAKTLIAERRERS